MKVCCKDINMPVLFEQNFLLFAYPKTVINFVE